MTHAIVLHGVPGEARIKDTDLAERLGYAEPRQIRRVIRAHLEKLNEIGSVQVSTYPHPYRGDPIEEFALTIRQAVYICLQSGTKTAAEVAMAIADRAIPQVPRTLPEALRAYATEIEAHEQTKQRVQLLEAKSGSRPDRMSCLAYAKMCGITLSNGQLSRLSKLAKQNGERHGRKPESVNDERWGSVLIHHVADLDAAWSFYFRPPVATDGNPAALPAPGARA